MIVLLCVRSTADLVQKPYLLCLFFPCTRLVSRPDRPQFYEIYTHGAVVGISITFMAIDCLGGVFSILSLIFKRHVDVLAAVAYALVVVRPLTVQINIV